MTISAPSDASRTDGHDTGRCSGCGSEAPADAGRCPDCGRFLPGNEAVLVHGARRLQDGQETALQETRRVSLRDAVLEDLGGEENVSEVLSELVEDFASAVQLRDVAWAHIAAVGPLTKAGRRRAVVDLYLQASRRAEPLAKEIGTERREAPVPSLEEALRQSSGGQAE